MNSVYAMQRANGDWFALDQSEGFRVPIFSSNREATVLVDERALDNLAPADGQRPAHFWLVSDACLNMKRGVAMNHAELAQMIRGETLKEKQVL